MAVICHGNPTNRVLGTAFDNYAHAMSRQWATALIPNPGHGDAIDGEPGRADADDCSAMRSGVIKANDVRHIQVSLDGTAPLFNNVGGSRVLGCSAYLTRRHTVLVLISGFVPLTRSMNDKSRLTIAGGIAEP